VPPEVVLPLVVAGVVGAPLFGDWGALGSVLVSLVGGVVDVVPVVPVVPVVTPVALVSGSSGLPQPLMAADRTRLATSKLIAFFIVTTS
jgi:hypothetical protein